jgi:hypothetical protein
MDSLAVGFLVLFGESGAEGWQVVGENLGCEQYGVLCGYAVCFLADYGRHSAVAFAGCESFSEGCSGDFAMGEPVLDLSDWETCMHLLTDAQYVSLEPSYKRLYSACFADATTQIYPDTARNKLLKILVAKFNTHWYPLGSHSGHLLDC